MIASTDSDPRPLAAPPLPGSEHCPYRTAALPPIGGRIGDDPADFQVDERPAYAPAGDGEHHFVRIRKTGLSTPEAVDLLAAAAGVDRREIGYAGRKDKHAVTTQWLSLPAPPVAPADPRIELLETARHGRKLRLGHLAANRFTIRLVALHDDAPARLPALVAAIAHGVPNYFGPQRFGRFGLRDALNFARDPRRRVKDPRFFASVLQSAVFNRWLGDRTRDGLLDVALAGDVLRKRDTGGLFTCADAAEDTARVAAGALDPMGPLPGPKLMPAHDLAAEREQTAAAAYGTDLALGAIGRFAPGTRRVSRLVAEDLDLRWEGASLVARFTLPAGCYATTLLAELCHPATGDLRREEG